jgi:hypothetical protein
LKSLPIRQRGIHVPLGIAVSSFGGAASLPPEVTHRSAHSRAVDHPKEESRWGAMGQDLSAGEVENQPTSSSSPRRALPNTTRRAPIHPTTTMCATSASCQTAVLKDAVEEEVMLASHSEDGRRVGQSAVLLSRHRNALFKRNQVLRRALCPVRVSNPKSRG